MDGDGDQETGRRDGHDKADDEPRTAFRDHHQRVLEIQHRPEKQKSEHGGSRQHAGHTRGDHRIGRGAQRAEEGYRHRRRNQRHSTDAVDRAGAVGQRGQRGAYDGCRNRAGQQNRHHAHDIVVRVPEEVHEAGTPILPRMLYGAAITGRRPAPRQWKVPYGGGAGRAVLAVAQTF